MILKFGMQHRGLKFYKVCINGDTGLTLTYFTARSILETYAKFYRKNKNSGFSKTISACYLKVGRCRQLVEFMKVCEY